MPPYSANSRQNKAAIFTAGGGWGWGCGTGGRLQFIGTVDVWLTSHQGNQRLGTGSTV